MDERYFFNLSPNVLCVIDTDGKLLSANPALERVLGYTTAELQAIPWREIYHPDDYDAAITEIRRLAASGERSVGFRVRCRRKDGVYVWLSWDATLEPESNLIYAIGHDIRQQVQVEQDLDASEAQYRLLVEQIKDIVYKLRLVPGFQIEYLSPSVLDHLGYKPDDFQADSQFLLNIIHPDDRDRIEAFFNAPDILEPYLQLRCIHRDGRTIWLELRSAPIIEDGSIVGVQGVARDITQRRENETALQHSREFLQAELDALTVHVAILDENGAVIAVNRAWRALEEAHGTDGANDGLGQNYLEACESGRNQEGKPTADAIRKMLSGEVNEFYLEYPFQSADKERWFSMRLARFEISGQLHLIVMHFEITERVKAEAEQREQRALAEAFRDTTAAILTGSLSIDTVMMRILENVERVVPHDMADIILIEGNEARIAYWRGYPPSTDEIFQIFRLPLDTRNIREMLDTGNPCLIADTREYEGWITASNDFEVRGHMGIPIHSNEQILGFLTLGSNEPGFFNSIHAERLQTFADNAAIAIENAQMYQRLEENANEMAIMHRATSFLFTSMAVSHDINKLSSQLVETVVKSFGLVDCGVMLIDPVRRELVRVARGGDFAVQAEHHLYLDAPGLVLEAIRLKKALYAPDVRQDLHYVVGDPRTRSELVVPLRTANGVIGVLDLQSSKLDAFGERDQRVLEVFAERAAMAIENAQFYEALRQHTDELEHRVIERTAELYQAKERVEAILNSSSNAIVLTDADGAIQQTNPAFDSLFGFAPQQAVNQSVEMLVAQEDAPLLYNVLKTVVRDGQTRLQAVTALGSQGTPFSAEVGVSAIKEDSGAAQSLVCTFQDITHHKRIEESLRNALAQEQELGELKTRFVTMASHEFRTPLASILSTSELLRSYRSRMDEEEIDRRLGIIAERVIAMTRLLEDILIIGRMDAGKLRLNLEWLSASDLCHSIVEEVQSVAGERYLIRLNMNDDCPQVWADKKLLHQILSNLLSNAVKYTPNGGTVDFSLNCHDDNLVFNIKDTGIGIPEKDQSRIFEAFHRAENVGTISGTGLGLAIAKRAIEMHGGTISFTSRVGEGTEFTLVIPREAPEEEAV